MLDYLGAGADFSPRFNLVGLSRLGDSEVKVSHLLIRRLEVGKLLILSTRLGWMVLCPGLQIGRGGGETS